MVTQEAIECIAKHGTCSPHWEPYVGIYLAQECERLRAALREIRDSGNWVHPLGAALVKIALEAIGPAK